LLAPAALHADLCYTVLPGHMAHLIYFRGGNAADGLIYLSVVTDGAVRRYFPIGPQGTLHVPLAIREEIAERTRIEIHLAADAGLMGTVVVDAGLVVTRAEP
jgi:assimilatory nitrate reductase catalytic subunit